MTDQAPKSADIRRNSSIRKSFSFIAQDDGPVFELDTQSIEELCSPDISLGDVASKMASDFNVGLTNEEAARRLTHYGLNELEKKEKMSLWMLFLSQFASLIIVILIVAAIISMVVGEFVEGVAVIVIILITVSLSTATEYSSGNALDALAELADPHTHVYRSGELKKIRTPELVPGDVIELSPGDLVPADARIIQAFSAKVNEMILTGESADVAKKEIVSSSASSTKLTNVNMVYSSTSLVEGRVRALVMLTGMRTKVGSIAALLVAADQASPEKDELEKSGRGKLVRRMSMGHSLDELPEVEDAGENDEYAPDSDDEDDVERGGSPSEKKKKGEDTCVDKLREKIRSYQPKKTPLQESLHRLGLIMTGFAISGSVLVVIVGIFRNFRDPNNDDNPPWLQSILLAVSMAVSAIPEGLPLVVTICLALGTTAMAKSNALIRRLPAVETLGSASVICSDKTGTLTSGKMTLTKAWTLDKAYALGGEGYDPTKGFVTDVVDNQVADVTNVTQNSALACSMYVANLCNEASVKNVDGKWKSIGTSTEAALVVGTEKFGIDTAQNRSVHKRVLNVPFSSTFKMMTTIHEVSPNTEALFGAGTAPTGGLVTLAKGAPLAVLKLCVSAHTNAGIVPLTPELVEKIQLEVDTLSASGLRVLAMCYKRTPALPDVIAADVENSLSSEEKLTLCVSDMTFCGLLGMMDPPRVGVRASVRRAKRGGVRTVMITGDYLKTAIAIAEMVDILEPTMDAEESAVDCSVLRPDGVYLHNHEIDAITWHSFVFARAKPEDKLQIVKSFQRQGLVCAMTGDGVNDAPALRQANIGIAMGLAGSEVAKAASDMILTDDKFTSIVEAVELGRTIYANLRKFVMYFIGTNWSQVLVILLSVLIGMPAPLEPLQILYINLITDGAPAIALSIEKAEANVMTEKPRQKDEEILSGVIIVGVIRHAIGLVIFMLFSFFMGLWWEIGFVFLDHMYNDDGDLIETCTRLNGAGEWNKYHDKDCVKEGLQIARTMVFLTIVFSESLRPLTARSFSASLVDNLFDNRHLLYAIAFSISCTFFIVFTPVVNTIFHVAPPSWYEWLLVMCGVVITIISDEHLKMTLRATRENESRWNKLFDRLADSQREIRNMRHRLTELTTEKDTK